MVGRFGCVPVVSVGVPHVAGIPVQGPEALAVCCSRPDDLRSWSLGGPNAKVATCEAEMVPGRRTQANPLRAAKR